MPHLPLLFGFFAIAASTVAFAVPLNAHGTTITHSVNVSAESGGNTAGAGEVIYGKSEVRSSVRTVINGETVEDRNEEASSEDGSEARVQIESKHQSDDATAKVETEAQVSAEALRKTQIAGAAKAVTSPKEQGVSLETKTKESARVESSEQEEHVEDRSIDPPEPKQTFFLIRWVANLFNYVFNLF